MGIEMKAILGVLIIASITFAVVMEYSAIQQKSVAVRPAYNISADGNSSSSVVAGETASMNFNIEYYGSQARVRNLDFDILAEENIYVGYNDTMLQDANYPEIVIHDDAAMVAVQGTPAWGYAYPYYAYSCINKTADATHSFDYIKCVAANVPFSANANKTMTFAFETNEFSNASVFDVRVKVVQ